MKNKAEEIVRILRDIEEHTESKRNHARACNETIKELKLHLKVAMQEHESGQLGIEDVE